MNKGLKAIYKIILIVFCLMVFFMNSCSKKVVKTVSEDSRIATEAIGVIEKIKEAYLRNDISTLQAYTTRDGFRSIRGVLKVFDSADLSFEPVWVEIKKDVVYVNISWKGRWSRGGKITDERGMAIFALKGIPLKVDNILRANPFIYPE